jgi:DNA-binding IclR family transcriptional regulator
VSSTPVPAVDRAIAIVNFLADNPHASFSLSEIARRTGIHKATSVALLSRLTAHGFVVRDDSKHYSLGPASLGLSFQYSQRFPGFVDARAEMFRLADKLGLGSSICAIDTDELVILDVAGNLQPRHLPTRVGRRIPLVPPSGTVFKAWAGADEIKAWLSAMAERYELDESAQLQVIASIRARGYSLGSEQDFDIKLDTVLRKLESEDLDTRSVSMALMVADKLRGYRGSAGDSVDYLVAPIFNSSGTVFMSLQLFGEPGQITRDQVEPLSVELLRATGRITRHIHGVMPEPTSIF